MGLTAIKSINNRHTSETYYVKNVEHPDDTGGQGNALAIPPGEAIPCNMWIPWCTTQEDYNNKHKIKISPVANTPVVIFTIWQDGDYVRYSKDGLFHVNGDLVPGNCTVNGDRSVEITGTTPNNAQILFY